MWDYKILQNCEKETQLKIIAKTESEVYKSVTESHLIEWLCVNRSFVLKVNANPKVPLM